MLFAIFYILHFLFNLGYRVPSVVPATPYLYRTLILAVVLDFWA
jgi:hypothetical protein